MQAPLSAQRWTGPPPEPFTAHLRRLRIELDPDQYRGADGELVFERARHQGPHLSEITVRCAGLGASDRPPEACVFLATAQCVLMNM